MIKNKIGIKDVSRSAHTTRWHSVGVHRNQSVAEHSGLTSLYVDFLILGINPNVTPQDHLLALRYSLWHDQPEVITGDLCTPLKRLLEAYLKNEFPLEKIEKILCEQYKSTSEAIENTYIKNITKLADYLDAILYLEEEGKEKQAQKIKLDIINSYRALITKSQNEYPDYHWEEAETILTKALNDEPLQIDDIDFKTLLK